MATLTSGNQEGNFQLQITSEQNIEWRCLGTGDAWRRQFDLHVWPALLACLHGTGNRRAVVRNAFELRVGTSIEPASCHRVTIDLKFISAATTRGAPMGGTRGSYGEPLAVSWGGH